MKRRLSRGERGATWTLAWTLAWAVALGVVGPPEAADAGVVRQRSPRVPLAAGTTIFLDTRDYQGGEARVTRVDVEASSGGTVSYSWVSYMHQAEMAPTVGGGVVGDLGRCQGLDPQWLIPEGGMQQAGREARRVEHARMSQRCHLWLSQAAYRDLKAHGEALFQPSAILRGDRNSLSVRLEEETTLRVEVDGEIVALPVLALSTDSDLHDRLVVLDSASNPLVLQAHLPGTHNWSVTAIHVNTPAPPAPLLPY